MQCQLGQLKQPKGGRLHIEEGFEGLLIWVKIDRPSSATLYNRHFLVPVPFDHIYLTPYLDERGESIFIPSEYVELLPHGADIEPYSEAEWKAKGGESIPGEVSRGESGET